MAPSRERKKELIEEYGAKLSRAQVAIWSNFSGLTVAQVTDLRRQLRKAGAETMVVKNTLMRIALERADLPLDEEIMGGPCLVTFVYDDLAPAAKAVVDFARRNEQVLSVKGGLLNGELVTKEQIQALTNLPSRDVLLARVIGGMQAPVSGFVNTLAAIMRGLVNVLNAYSDKLQSAES